MKHYTILRKRKAISTIVGTLFFVVILIGGFAALSTAFELQFDLIETQFDIGQQEIKKSQEKFRIGPIYNPTGGNLFCLSVVNEGTTPVQIEDLWISNKSSTDDFDTNLVNITFADAFVPMGSTVNILDNQRITFENKDRTYDIKVVSASGISRTEEIKVFGNPGNRKDPRINSTLSVAPPNQATSLNVTLTQTIRNVSN